MRRLPGLIATLIVAAVAVSEFGPSAGAAGDRVTVFAAASLKNALDDVAMHYKSATGNDATVSYAASSALAKQIVAGAPADVFISADLEWMAYLKDKKALKPETQKNLFGNTLVLIAPKNSTVELKLAPNAPLKDVLGDGRLAVGETSSVPAGKYAKSALEHFAIWQSVKDKLAQVENVRAALALVARGEAPLGIVYATDAASEANVRIVATFPEGAHPPIVYPVAVTATASGDSATGFIGYLASPEAGAIVAKYGFTLLKQP